MELLPSRPWAPVPCPPLYPLFCAQLKPFYPYIAPGLTVHSAQNRGRRSSTSPLMRLCWASAAAAVGLLLKNNIMNWDIISKHPAGRHRSTQCTLGHSGAVFTLSPTSARSERMPDDRKCMKSTMWWSKEKGMWKEVTIQHIESWCQNVTSGSASVSPSVWNVSLELCD